jgi:hypothetical protein
VTAIRRSEDRLLADAVRDRLTGLPNRALFLDRLEQAIGRARDWADAELHVIVLDLDRFKSFNDGLGVEAGDYLLPPRAAGCWPASARRYASPGCRDTSSASCGMQAACLRHRRSGRVHECQREPADTIAGG